MQGFVHRRIALTIALLALVIFAMAAALGGPGAAADVEAIGRLAQYRMMNPAILSPAILVTTIGGAAGMVSILVVSLVVLAIARRWRDGLLLGLIVVGGRGVVEVIKLVIDRPRPHYGDYPVPVSSLSFPSAHSANSMITFLALALIVVPSRYRPGAVVAGVAGSMIVGVTRPLLGVHWPSDVIGGWSFGIAWVVSALLTASASGYWLASRDAHPD